MSFHVCMRACLQARVAVGLTRVLRVQCIMWLCVHTCACCCVCMCSGMLRTLSACLHFVLFVVCMRVGGHVKLRCGAVHDVVGAAALC